MAFLTVLLIGLELIAVHRPIKPPPKSSVPQRVEQWKCTSGMMERVGDTAYQKQSCTLVIVKKSELYRYGGVGSECLVIARHVSKSEWAGEIVLRDGPLLAAKMYTTRISINRFEDRTEDLAGVRTEAHPAMTDFLEKKLADVCPVRNISGFPADVLKALIKTVSS